MPATLSKPELTRQRSKSCHLPIRQPYFAPSSTHLHEQETTDSSETRGESFPCLASDEGSPQGGQRTQQRISSWLSNHDPVDHRYLSIAKTSSKKYTVHDKVVVGACPETPPPVYSVTRDVLGEKLPNLILTNGLNGKPVASSSSLQPNGSLKFGLGDAVACPEGVLFDYAEKDGKGLRYTFRPSTDGDVDMRPISLSWKQTRRDDTNKDHSFGVRVWQLRDMFGNVYAEFPLKFGARMPHLLKVNRFHNHADADFEALVVLSSMALCDSNSVFRRRNERVWAIAKSAFEGGYKSGYNNGYKRGSKSGNKSGYKGSFKSLCCFSSFDDLPFE